MKIGDKVKIQTKKGIVEKYLSYVCPKTRTYYFTDNEQLINGSKIGYVFKTRGTAHSFKNIIWE